MTAQEHSHRPAAGDVAAMPLPGGYAACQVTQINARHMVACALDSYSVAMPTLEQVATARPLVNTQYWSDGEVVQIVCEPDRPAPLDFVWLGSLPPRLDDADDGGVYDDLRYLAREAFLQRRWDSVPAPTRAAYKDLRDAGDTDAAEVEIDFGAGPVRISMESAELDLVGGVPVPAMDPVRWEALDVLPTVTSLSWSGDERGLIGALADNPQIDSLYWSSPPEVIDLASTNLTTLVIEGARIEVVRLPASVISLGLGASRPQQVVAAESGRWVQLSLSHSAVPAGLEAVREVWFEPDGDFQASGNHCASGA